MKELKDIIINCDGYDFVNERSINDRKIDLEDLLDMCNEFYLENQRLIEEKEELIEDMEENYKRIAPEEQYGINNNDFI